MFSIKVLSLSIVPLVKRVECKLKEKNSTIRYRPVLCKKIV